MKLLILTTALLLLTGCGGRDPKLTQSERWDKNVECVNGVEYYIYNHVMAVKYLRNGNISTCTITIGEIEL